MYNKIIMTFFSTKNILSQGPFYNKLHNNYCVTTLNYRIPVWNVRAFRKKGKLIDLQWYQQPGNRAHNGFDHQFNPTECCGRGNSAPAWPRGMRWKVYRVVELLCFSFQRNFCQVTGSDRYSTFMTLTINNDVIPVLATAETLYRVSWNPPMEEESTIINILIHCTWCQHDRWYQPELLHFDEAFNEITGSL